MDDPGLYLWFMRRNKKPPTPREQILDGAKTAIMGDRNNQYGPPDEDFVRTAGALSELGFQVDGEPLDPHHVAVMMIVLKTRRLMWDASKLDTWLDIAGYAACGYETYTLRTPL